MTNKTKVYLALVVGLAAAGSVTAAIAVDRACIDPEAEVLRGIKRQGGENTPEGKEKLKGLSIHEKLEREVCDRQSMSKTDKGKEVEKGRKAELDHQKDVEQWKKAGLLERKNVSNPQQGIYPGEQVDPTMLGAGYLLPANYWVGSVAGKSVMVVATALSDNPLQGVLIVMEDGHPTNAKTYLTPTASGPVKISAEKNGVLALQSLAGDYETYNIDTDTRKKVNARGGSTFNFNLGSQSFSN